MIWCPSRPVATALSAAVIAVAVGLFLLTTASHIAAVDLYVENRGCGDLRMAATLQATTGIAAVDHPVLNLLGITLPEVIEDGAREVVSLPPLRLDLDNETDPRELRIRALGQDLPVPLGQPTDLLFDGESLLGRRVPITLRPLGEHNLTITCED